MKFEFDEIGFKDEIDLMNIERQMKQNYMQNNNQTMGFNLDQLYNTIDNIEE